MTLPKKIFVTLLLAGLMLTACQPAKPEVVIETVEVEVPGETVIQTVEVQITPEVEIVTLHYLSNRSPESMSGLINAFEAQYPNIKVVAEEVPFADLNNVLGIRLGAGEVTPDVYRADQPRTAAYVNQGWLLDLTDLLGDISDIVLASSIEACTVNGRLYASPESTSTQILFYNKDLLEAAGIDFPSLDPENRLTWEQIYEDAAKAQAAGAKWGVMLDQVNRIYQIQPLPESLGGGSGVTGDDMLTPAITNDAWIQALTFYHSLFEDGLAPRGVPVEQTSDLFANGEVAYHIGGTWWLPTFVGAEGLNFGIAPHPYFEDGEPVTPTGAWSYGINPNTEHLEEALAFVKYATLDYEGALKTAEVYPLPPANIAVLDSYYSRNVAGYLTGVDQIIAYELEYTAVVRPRTIGYIQFEEIMGAALEDIRNGADVAATLEKAEQDLIEAWSRLE